MKDNTNRSLYQYFKNSAEYSEIFFIILTVIKVREPLNIEGLTAKLFTVYEAWYEGKRKQNEMKMTGIRMLDNDWSLTWKGPFWSFQKAQIWQIVAFIGKGVVFQYPSCEIKKD